MNFIKTISNKNLKKKHPTGCNECQASCQSACKTSCTVGNQSCAQDQALNKKNKDNQ